MPDAEPDLHFSQRALDLAAKGIGLVSPNPLVGCVIIGSNGDVVGEGHYEYDRVTHAEVAALREAGDRASGGTAYVSLEPHSHHGRTPPCTEALIDAGIARVVCPVEDPNPKVSGRGFERLRNAGIEVVTGILADEASRLNESFFCWHTNDRPFVHLKLAMSLDGRISLRDSVSTALSGDMARERVQEIRHQHDAILIGGRTARIDDPSLTDRSGRARRRPLVRVILDNSLGISPEATLVKTAVETPTLIFTNSSDQAKIDLLHSAGAEVVASKGGGRDLAEVLADLKGRGIQSVLVEGGRDIAGSFCDARLVDKVTLIATPIIIGGSKAPNAIGGTGAAALPDALRLTKVAVGLLGDDVEITGYPSA